MTLLMILDNLQAIGIDNLVTVLFLFMIDIGFCILSFVAAELVQYFGLKTTYKVFLIIFMVICFTILAITNYCILTGGTQ